MSVRTSIPKTGFDGRFSWDGRSGFSRAATQPSDFEWNDVNYRVKRSGEGDVLVGGWLGGDSHLTARYGSNELLALPTRDAARTDEEYGTLSFLSHPDATGSPVFAFDFGHLELALSSAKPLERTTIAAGSDGAVIERSWRRDKDGWAYTVRRLHPWKPTPGQTELPATAVYLKDGKVVEFNDAGAVPHGLTWTEVQAWEDGGLWWRSLIRTDSGGVVMVKSSRTRIQDQSSTRPAPEREAEPLPTTKPVKMEKGETEEGRDQ